MTEGKALELLRETYRSEDTKTLERRYLLLKSFLSPDNQEKVHNAILKKKELETQKLTQYALSVLGGRIVDK